MSKGKKGRNSKKGRKEPVSVSRHRVIACFVFLVLALMTVAGIMYSGQINETSKAGDEEGAETQTSFPNDLEYHLIISQDFRDYYDDDSTWNIFRPFTGTITPYINGSPVGALSGNGVDAVRDLRVDHLLQAGENSITFEGDFEDELFAKVITLPTERSGMDNLQVLGKTRLPPGVKNSELRFEGPSAGSPHLDLLPMDEEGKAKVRNDVLSRIAMLRKKIELHEGLDFATEIVETIPSEFQRYGWSDSYLELYKNSLEKYLSDPDCKLETTMEDVKLIMGQRVVYAYSDFSWLGIARLFDTKVGEFQAPVPALQFVRVDGEWVILPQ